MDRLRAHEQKESVQESFVIAESKRLIPLKIEPNELKPNLGTLRLLASADANNEEEPVCVLIQAMKGGRPCLSFAIPKEDILQAGEVFDLLTSDPYTKTARGVSASDPLTEEKIVRTFKTVARISRLPDSRPPRDDVRQNILSLISRGITRFSTTVGGTKESALSLETMLMKYVEATLRGNAALEQEKRPQTIGERVAAAGTKLADNLMYGSTEKQEPKGPENP